MSTIRAAIINVSDKSSRGEREDTSGPLRSQAVTAMGAEVIATHVIPDEREQISDLLAQLADQGQIDLIVTTGGTGSCC